jgi:S-layer homology domain
MKKLLITLLFILAFTTALVPSKSNAASPFKDLSTKHWAYNDIMYFVNEKEIGGFPDGTFRAEKEISRAEFVAIISRFVDSKYLLEDTTKPFKDKANWADEAILLAVNLGVIVPSEYGDYFNPNTPITRLEMAKMAARTLATYDDSYKQALTQTLNTKLPFADLTKFAKENAPFVAVVNGTGIINGYVDDTFKPSNKATRAEAVAILARLKRLGKSEKPAAEFKKLQEFIQLSTLGNNIEAVTGIKVKSTKDLKFTYGTWSIKFKNIIAFDPAIKTDAFFPMFRNYTYARPNYQLAAEVEVTTSKEFNPFSLTNIQINKGSGFFSNTDAKKFGYTPFQEFTNLFPVGTTKGYLSGVIIKGEEVVALTGTYSKEGYYILND